MKSESDYVAIRSRRIEREKKGHGTSGPRSDVREMSGHERVIYMLGYTRGSNSKAPMIRAMQKEIEQLKSANNTLRKAMQ